MHLAIASLNRRLAHLHNMKALERTEIASLEKEKDQAIDRLTLAQSEIDQTILAIKRLGGTVATPPAKSEAPKQVVPAHAL